MLFNSFVVLRDGKFDATGANALCLIYQFATENVPSSIDGVLELPLVFVHWAARRLNAQFKNLGCPLKFL